MDPNEQLDLVAESATQSRWAMANNALALLCIVLAGGAFLFGYVVAGWLVLVASWALVVNADAHKKRGHFLKGEAKVESEP